MTISNSENRELTIPKTIGTRRGFIYGITRGTLLMGLAFMGIRLAHKNESNCLNMPLCKDCAKFNNCLLPRAERERGK